MTTPTHEPFPAHELGHRLAAVRVAMAAHDLDCIVISVPENIYYMTGLDHWGFFACHLLVVPAAGEMVLLCRAMERITVENQVRNARFVGHADSEDIAAYAAAVLADLRLTGAKVGLEMRSLFFTPRIADALRDKVSAAWRDASGLVDTLRLVKSQLEMDYTRHAAGAAEEGALAAIDAVHDGAPDYIVAAECQRALTAAGSEYPGFGPFIRPQARLGEEHTTWRGDIFSSKRVSNDGEAVFLEIAGCYRRYHAPMGRLVYVGAVPTGGEAAAALAIDGMRAIVGALMPGAKAGEAYAAWHAVAAAAGLPDYHRHHCGYLVGIGFPPSWSGGSMVTSLAPDSQLELQVGMVFHAHSWFTNTGDNTHADYFISNTVLLTDAGAQVLTNATPETLIVK